MIIIIQEHIKKGTVRSWLPWASTKGQYSATTHEEQYKVTTLLILGIPVFRFRKLHSAE